MSDKYSLVFNPKEPAQVGIHRNGEIIAVFSGDNSIESLELAKEYAEWKAHSISIITNGLGGAKILHPMKHCEHLE